MSDYFLSLNYITVFFSSLIITVCYVKFIKHSNSNLHEKTYIFFKYRTSSFRKLNKLRVFANYEMAYMCMLVRVYVSITHNYTYTYTRIHIHIYTYVHIATRIISTSYSHVFLWFLMFVSHNSCEATHVSCNLILHYFCFTIYITLLIKV